ncbi:MAG TPA: CAP domain-containing protein [Pyrinomonadaceae bacterium]|nr:CAP domain-containing protein [Pyrinomonadaceae bacterium]
MKRNESIKKFDTDEDKVFALVNDERQKNNLNFLVRDNQLAEIARDYSKRMAEENFFDHFDPQGANVVVRAKKAKLKHWNKIGENLFSVEGMENFDAFAVKNWMESPTHRQNILDKDFNTAGIGIVESGDGEIFITQVFIKR